LAKKLFSPRKYSLGIAVKIFISNNIAAKQEVRQTECLWIWPSLYWILVMD